MTDGCPLYSQSSREDGKVGEDLNGRRIQE